MIRGRFLLARGRRRPTITASLLIPSQGISGEVDFLIDTGADSTLLGPYDAHALGIDVDRLGAGPTSTGVGGSVRTGTAGAHLILGHHTLDLDLWVLVPSGRRQQAALSQLPSLLGRDVLAHFALVMEERTGRVLLLEPDESDALGLP